MTTTKNNLSTHLNWLRKEKPFIPPPRPADYKLDEPVFGSTPVEFPAATAAAPPSSAAVPATSFPPPPPPPLPSARPLPPEPLQRVLPGSQTANTNRSSSIGKQLHTPQEGEKMARRNGLMSRGDNVQLPTPNLSNGMLRTPIVRSKITAPSSAAPGTHPVNPSLR